MLFRSSIDGGGGANALDYAAYTTDVTVILPNHSATGVGGSVFRIRDVTGSRGPGSNILVGDGGNTLRGGSGRDLLIAGAGPGILLGGDGEDILVGGSTAYDRDAVALRAIMDEWLRTDVSYEERVDHLLNGGGRADLRHESASAPSASRLQRVGGREVGRIGDSRHVNAICLAALHAGCPTQSAFVEKAEKLTVP